MSKAFIQNEQHFKEWNHSSEHIGMLIIGAFVVLTLVATMFPLMPFLMQ